MDRESELQRLEKFVEKILTRFTALKAEKTQLEQDVFERDHAYRGIEGDYRV